MPQLRSLYIPFLADHVHGTNADPRELALQIVDIVALRPEVELCYMGIANKCFEILESKRDHDPRNESHLGLPAHGLEEEQASDPDEEEEEDEEEEVEDDDSDVTESDASSSGYQTDSDLDEEIAGKSGTARLRLREILFYDDKVAVFKARHGRL